MSEPKEKSNIFYITHKGELLIWLIIILLITLITTTINIHNKKNENDYNIFMPDVDGLIVGSPVRMMGIEIGNVTKIQPTNTEVFVKFTLTDKDLDLPQGTVATVEFSGMAGSKSLELYLPNQNIYIDKNTPILSVSAPKRLHDALGLLNEMFEKLGSIIYTSSSFSTKLKALDLPTGTNENIENFIEYTDNMVDNATEKAENIQTKLYEVHKNVK